LDQVLVTYLVIIVSCFIVKCNIVQMLCRVIRYIYWRDRKRGEAIRKPEEDSNRNRTRNRIVLCAHQSRNEELIDFGPEGTPVHVHQREVMDKCTTRVIE